MSRLWAAMAVCLCMLLPFSQTVFAQVHRSVTCCCGEHDAATDCGCPDCPAAQGASVKDSERERVSDNAAVRPCSGRKDIDERPRVVRAIVPALFRLVPLLASAPRLLESDARPPSRIGEVRVPPA